MASKLIKTLLGIMAGMALALGIALAGTTPAQAATRTVWDKVATCESGNRWHINTGNGYYGGLQFSPRTWAGFGGRAYASQAHRATKAEQIAIARRVLAAQGPGAWPTCSRKAGLTRANGKASTKATPATNPGVTKTTKPKAAVKSKATTVKQIKVRSGDTLAKIATRYHVKGGWRTLYKLNAKKLASSNLIFPGQLLRIR